MGFAGIQLGKVHYMPVGANHEMPIIIRKLVHDNKGMPPPVKDEALFVFLCVARKAKHAGIRFWSKNIFNTPRSPQLFHSFFLYTA